MTYDLDFRYRRALQPEGLTTVLTAVQAVQDAIKDARNAGLDPEHDPAVTLLARHVGRLADPAPDIATKLEDQGLRARCIERIDHLKGKPAIIALVCRGLDKDIEAQRAFHREAGGALCELALNIGIDRADYDIHHAPDRVGVVGDVVLRSDEIHIRIAANALTIGREITYRRPRTRHDEFGGKPHHADIGKLTDVPRLARQVARDLQLRAGNDRSRFA